MAYAVEMYFDILTDSTVRGMWQSIAASGVPSAMLLGGYRPHVTLAVYDELKDDGWFASTLEVLAGVAPPIHLTFNSFGVFPTAEWVLFLGVTVTDSLNQLHSSFHSWFADYRTGLRSYYAPDHWVPHCTLALGLSLDQMTTAIQSCAAVTLPLTARVLSFGLVEVSRTTYREIAEFALSPLD